MINSKTTKTLISAVVFMFTAIGAVVYMWFYIDKIGSKLETDIQSLKDSTILLQEYSALESELIATADERDSLSLYVLSGEGGTIEFLSQIDDVAGKLGLTVQTRSLDVAVTEEKGFDLIVAEFSVQGAERSVMKMLKLFESLPYKSEVSNLSVSRSIDSGTGLRTMTQNLKVQVSLLEQ